MTNLRIIKDGKSIKVVEHDSLSTIDSPMIYILTVMAMCGFVYAVYKMMAPIFFL